MTYDPLADSSPGTVDLRAADTDAEDNPGVEPTALILDVSDSDGFKTCSCGCRAQITSKASFKQGHDQRLVGKLVRAGRAGVEVAIYGGDLLHTTPIGAANHLFPTDAGVEKVRFGIALATKASPKAKAPKSQSVDEVGSPDVLVEVGTVKIGRWTYPAKQMGDNSVLRNEKPNGQGKWVAADAKLFVPA